MSCASPEKQVSTPVIIKPAFDLSTLEGFFKTTEADALRAKQVVEKNKIIFNLTHLKLMNTGGRKYYLLERENITEMINAVTEGIYLDYILINRSGDIIYTRTDENIFGNNINKGFEDTPIRRCYTSRDAVHFEDVSAMTTASSILGLYVSVPIVSEDSFQGTLILQIDIDRINHFFDEQTDIISREGLIRVTADRKRILSQYYGFTAIDIPSLDRDSNWSDNSSGARTDYSVFKYKNISWIIARKGL
jgi:hypothetical protein